MMDDIPREALKELINTHKALYFVNPKEVRDSEALGIMINHYFDLDAIEVLDTASTSLSDANLDEESKFLREKMNKMLT